MFTRTTAAVAATALFALTTAATAAPRDRAAAAPRVAVADTTAASAPRTASPSPATKYCVQQKFTGSLITRTACKTRAQWIRQAGVDPLNLN